MRVTAPRARSLHLEKESPIFGNFVWSVLLEKYAEQVRDSFRN